MGSSVYVNPPLATPSSPGAMPATDKAKLDDLADAGWFDRQIATMKLAAPGVSAFRYRDWIRAFSPATRRPATN